MQRIEWRSDIGQVAFHCVQDERPRAFTFDAGSPDSARRAAEEVCRSLGFAAQPSRSRVSAREVAAAPIIALFVAALLAVALFAGALAPMDDPALQRRGGSGKRQALQAVGNVGAAIGVAGALFITIVSVTVIVIWWCARINNRPTVTAYKCISDLPPTQPTAPLA